MNRSNGNCVFPVPDSVEPKNTSSANQSSLEGGAVLPAIRKKERDFEGMFEFKKEDIELIIRRLVKGENIATINFFFITNN